MSGVGCDSCERIEFDVPDLAIHKWLIPFDCSEEPVIRDLIKLNGSAHKYLGLLGFQWNHENMDFLKREIIKARCRHDFEYCASQFFYIKDKNPNNTKPIKFLLNRGQRRLLKLIYSMDKAGKPVRIIICKRRQVGFSTMVQLYMAWKQLFQLPMARSQVVAHVENSARLIRGMYSLMIKKLPAWLLGLPEGTQLHLSPFEKSNKTVVVKEVGCRISIGSSEKPDNLAGDDASMVHFSEVGLFKTTTNIKPQQLIQTIVSGVAYLPNTMIVYESTARGVGNYFHSECLRAQNGESNNAFFFSPFFDKPDDILPIDNYSEFVRTMTPYEHWQFEQGATLESIKWYREASKGQPDKWRWKSEQPTTAEEAFQSTGHRYYPQDDVNRLRKGCRNPIFIGDVYADADWGEKALENINFKEINDGPLKIWFMPDTDKEHMCTDRYVVVVDIGGCSDHSDRSVICVLDRYDMAGAGVPIVAAEWCGHAPHYQIAWKAAQIATKYDNALLVIESNTLETEETEGGTGEFILDELVNFYDNIWCRTTTEKIMQGFEPKYGFHTNKSTKKIVCSHQQKVLAKDLYIETCKEACDEHDYIELSGNGAIGACEGQHDDRHITRAIGVWICYEQLEPPRLVDKIKKKPIFKRATINESTI